MRDDKRITRTIEKWEDDWPPENLGGFVTWAAEQLAAIPEAFRESAEIEITGDDGGQQIEISYRRPLTAEEHDEREARRNAAAERQRAKDKADFERLKEIFGGEDEANRWKGYRDGDA